MHRLLDRGRRYWRQMNPRWEALSLNQRFETLVALILTVLTSLIIVVALFRLGAEVINGLVFGALNPLDHKVFQRIFGHIMTVLIALEFNHTILYSVTREESIIQTKVVLLIALLALARKFIILDLEVISANQLLALGVVTIALGGTYWLVCERDQKREQAKQGHNL